MDMRSRWLGTAPPVLPQPYNRLIHLPWLVNDTCLCTVHVRSQRAACTRVATLLQQVFQSLVISKFTPLRCGLWSFGPWLIVCSSSVIASSDWSHSFVELFLLDLLWRSARLRQLPRIYLLTLQVKDWFANKVRKRRKKENNPLSRLSYAAHPDSGTVVPLASDSGTVLDRVPAVFIWYMSIIRRTC